MAVGVIGRDAELAVVDAFLDAFGDSLQVLAIEGEPGIGKTTIWQEGVRRAPGGGALVLVASLLRLLAAEANLTRIYRKLTVRSRAALARALYHSEQRLKSATTGRRPERST